MPGTADKTAAAATPDAGVANITPPQPGQVLRHAVFFSFKDESSEEDVQSVVNAFRELPSKIDSIIDFEWGTNNSPEGLDDGFTHCFLLTFKDGAGRAEYLPHEAHKAFGDVLRPHMKDVFVIDYWGTPAEPPVDNALRHAVFLKFNDDAAAEDIAKVEAGFAELPSKIDTIRAFEWGTNNSPEKHDDGFTHAFLVTFGSEGDRAAYLPHADHEAFVEVLKPVMDKVRVLDFFAQK
ncbi:MAG: Dabb family protein [Planctomycetaceae bacterium]